MPVTIHLPMFARMRGGFFRALHRGAGPGSCPQGHGPTIRCICQLGWRDTLNTWSEPQPPHKVQTSVAFLFVPRCRCRSASAHGPTNMSGCVAMALADNHHSRHEVEGGEHDGPRAQKTARATGARPGVLMEPSCREGQPRSVTWLPRGLSWWWRRWLAATALTPPRLLPPLCCAREEGRKRRRGSGRRSRCPLGSESVMACRCPRRNRKKRRCAEWARVPLSLRSVDDRPKMLDIMAGGEQKNNSVLLTCKVGFPGCSTCCVPFSVFKPTCPLVCVQNCLAIRHALVFQTVQKVTLVLFQQGADGRRLPARTAVCWHARCCATTSAGHDVQKTAESRNYSSSTSSWRSP